VTSDRIQFSVCSAIIIAATFIPIGSFAINPKIIGDVKLEGEPGDDTEDRRDEKGERISDDTSSDRKGDGPDLSPVVGV